MASKGLSSVFRGAGSSGGLNERRINERSGGNRDPHLIRFKDGESQLIQFWGTPNDKEHFKEFEQHARKYGNGWEFVPCIGDDCVPCQDEDEKFARPNYAFAAQVWSFKDKKPMIISGGTSLAQRIVFKYKQGQSKFAKKVFNITRLATTPKSYDIDTSDERPLRLENKEPVDIADYLAGRYETWISAHKSEISNRSSLDEDDDEEDYDEEDEIDDEEEVPTRKQMMKMDWAELKRYAKSIGVTGRFTKRSELIDAIKEELEDEE